MNTREHLEDYKRLKLTMLAYELAGDTQSPEYKKTIKRYTKKQKCVIEAINAAEDNNEKLVLTFRYLMGLSWRRTTDAMEEAGVYYCERQIYRIHKRAVKNLKIKEK